MQKILVSVYDKVSNIFSAPMAEPNLEAAKRNFKMGVMNNQMIMANPGDFELVVVGRFDDETGVLFPNTECRPETHALIISTLERIPVSEILGIRSDSSES